MKKTIENFIKNNELVFKDGHRNVSLVIICGYSLYKNIPLNDLINFFKNDERTLKELKRVYDYAKDNNYDKFWKTEKAKKQYIF